jgi:hypothetical protein
VTAVALAAVALWAAWWVANARHGAVVLAEQTWAPAYPMLGSDFRCHIDRAARFYGYGINPYFYEKDFFMALLPYPPAVVRAFGWVVLFPEVTALRVWLAALSLVIAAGALAAWRARRALGLSPVPAAAAVAAVLWSAPAVIAMERGQSDPLCVLPLAASAWLLRRGGLARELAAGGLLGATAWLKYYPGASVLGLLAMRRWKGAAAFVVVAGLIGAYDRAEVARSVANGRILAAQLRKARLPVQPLSHSLTGEWRAFRVVKRVAPLRRVPGALAAAALLLPAVAVVGRRVAGAGSDPRLTFPFFLWLTTAATFGMPYSNDYNLLPLPLCALAVWDRRDPVWVHLALGLLVACWQPLRPPVDAEVLFVVKLGALYAAGASLCARARGCAAGASEAARAAGRHAPRVAAFAPGD